MGIDPPLSPREDVINITDHYRFDNREVGFRVRNVETVKPRGPRTLAKGLGVVAPSLVEKGVEVAGAVCKIVFVQKKIPLWPLLRLVVSSALSTKLKSPPKTVNLDG